jgi:hypothetical protein
MLRPHYSRADDEARALLLTRHVRSSGAVVADATAGPAGPAGGVGDAESVNLYEALICTYY